MLPTFEDEISGMLSLDILEQLQDMDMFQQEEYNACSVHPNMITTKTEIPSPQAPMTLPTYDDLITPDESLMELENYYYSMPSPASTVDSEQEMNEALEVVMEDNLTSVMQHLPISPDPSQWTVEHVQAWVSLILRQYGRPEVNMCNFRVNGFQLCQMSQEELNQRAADNGDLIFSNLQCLVKNIQREDVKPVISAYQQQQYMEQQQIQHHSPPHGMVPPQLPCDPADFYFQYVTPNVAPVSPAMRTEPDMSPSPTASGTSSDEEEPSLSPSGPNTSMTPHHTGAIQLWQFLQELLIQPDSYNYCIRFLDRSQGIFKIEDSVEVARLWGMRKNRPAMNYDKLSRSIRQYYRKNIMKKTDISQRLVYQFVKPF